MSKKLQAARLIGMLLFRVDDARKKRDSNPIKSDGWFYYRGKAKAYKNALDLIKECLPPKEG